MEALLYIVGSLLLVSWIVCIALPFYVVYKLSKELSELHNEVEKEGD